MNDIKEAFVGLDIGTTEVVSVVGTKDENSPTVSIIGFGRSQNRGMRKGTIIDIQDTADAIGKAITEAERMSGKTITSVFTNLSGSHIKSLNSKGVVAVGGADHAITSEDLQRAEDAATVVHLPPNREITHVFARSYSLDGQDNIKDPIGMSGIRLEVDAHIVTASGPALKNLERTLHEADVAISGTLPSAIAASRGTVSLDQKEHGCLIIDIGGGTTSVAVFEENEIFHTASIPVGGLHVTNDLAVGLQTDLKTAEKIKLEHLDFSEASGKNVKVMQKSGKELELDLSQVRMIAEARLEEIFAYIDKELKKIKRAGSLPGGVTITGGTALTPGIENLAQKYLNLASTIGKPKNFSGVVDTVSSPRYATALGLMLEDMELRSYSEGRWSSSARGSAQNWLQSLLNKFKP